MNISVLWGNLLVHAQGHAEKPVFVLCPSRVYHKEHLSAGGTVQNQPAAAGYDMLCPPIRFAVRGINLLMHIPTRASGHCITIHINITSQHFISALWGLTLLSHPIRIFDMSVIQIIVIWGHMACTSREAALSAHHVGWFLPTISPMWTVRNGMLLVIIYGVRYNTAGYVWVAVRRYCRS
jgi:hypothetical protein